MIPCESNETKKRPVYFSRGKLYFSRSQERRFFWYATLVMSVLGLLYYWGVL